jgi:hypothetical protein
VNPIIMYLVRGEECQGLSSKSPDQENVESAVAAPAAGG